MRDVNYGNDDSLDSNHTLTVLQQVLGIIGWLRGVPAPTKGIMYRKQVRHFVIYLGYTTICRAMALLLDCSTYHFQFSCASSSSPRLGQGCYRYLSA